jgi:hypothetical protein
MALFGRPGALKMVQPAGIQIFGLAGTVAGKSAGDDSIACIGPRANQLEAFALTPIYLPWPTSAEVGIQAYIAFLRAIPNTIKPTNPTRFNQANHSPHREYNVRSAETTTVPSKVAGPASLLCSCPRIRPRLSLIVINPCFAERAMANPLSTPRKTAIRPCSQSSTVKSHAGANIN